MKPKVSIIVPVYNAEKFLHRCVNSILAQSLEQIELILVDDGSTDSSSKICDDYSAKDQRVRVIHKKNEGMGIAYNTGIKEAVGQYIGFVETDDWIEVNMYERLLECANKFDVDVVKSLYTEQRCDSVPKIVNKFGSSEVFYRKITDSGSVPLFYYHHPSHWSALYKTDFLKSNNIGFSTTEGASSQDIVFSWQVYLKMKSCCILPHSFYNYTVDNPFSSINQIEKTCFAAIKSHEWIQNWNFQEKVSPRMQEIEVKAIFIRFIKTFNAIKKTSVKFALTRKTSNIIKKYLPYIKFCRFSPSERKEVLSLTLHPFFYCFSKASFKNIKTRQLSVCSLFGIKIYERREDSSKICKRLFGIPYRKDVIQGEKKKFYLIGIPFASTIRDGNKKISKFIGIKFESEIIPKFANEVRMLQIITHANAISNTHSRTFLKYKNIYDGRDVVLIATGTSLNYFLPLKNCIYVGVNKAAFWPKVEYDYLFFQDFSHPQAYEIIDGISRCKKAKKFYGILQDIIRTDWIIPESSALKDDAERYYAISQWRFPPIRFTYDISSEALACPGSISFPAMQFILWTNPRRIYLVGQDNTSSYFDKSKSFVSPYSIACQLKGWKEMVKFIRIYYPNTEVISVNPVGLRGIFKDMYTKSYLSAHPDLKIPNENIIEP